MTKNLVSKKDLNDLEKLRQHLHQSAEISGQEKQTAEIIYQQLQQIRPDEIFTGLGGHGVAAVFEGDNPGGKTILVRSDLDALPIPETISVKYASKNPGASHKCGHDGHSTILVGLARNLSKHPLKNGNVILLFQPAEETGTGAAKVINDHKFKPIADRIDYAVALHNLPGYPVGQIVIREEIFASASIGMKIFLRGATSHAAEPNQGRSPALAVATLINSLSSVPQFHTGLSESSQVTIIHARVGEVAFGTSPGAGVVMATLRAHRNDVMDTIRDECERIAKGIAAAYQVDAEIEYVEEFPSTKNSPFLVDHIKRAALSSGYKSQIVPQPFPWSEDFGHFTHKWDGALFGLGSGYKQPALHHPTYDFPDELIPFGINMFYRIVKQIQSEE